VLTDGYLLFLFSLQATAMMYYKMFFLEHSANEWDVWQIAYVYITFRKVFGRAMIER
jgi:hypothetical protein